MNNRLTITVFVLLIALLSLIAASIGIFSRGGPGPFEYESIRGETVNVYGEGVYKHMSAEVAPQGIAQDYVTLFLAIPLLLISLLRARKRSLRGRFLLAGTLFYFLVTYLFYLVMAMYNELFLVYTALLGLSFFAFSLVMFSISPEQLPDWFKDTTPVTVTGGFLIVNSLMIGSLWLGVIVPPLADGSIIPQQAEHYTTLIVQGLDLGLLLPLSFLSGLLLTLKKPFGYLLAPTYFVFLSIMMTALIAKIIAMGLLGQTIFPVIFIIPTITVISIICTGILLKNIKDDGFNSLNER
ncbi:hypothetical protein [Rhodohalobacter sp. 8-1]|uniref:hypothetical protein n=1 Tax=Rhodohalobacter sp. 8-1 TaxID=3131972 RepID=UPI0030ECB823